MVRLGEEREAEGPRDGPARAPAVREGEHRHQAERERRLKHQVGRVARTEGREGGVRGDDEGIVVHARQRLLDQVGDEAGDGHGEEAPHAAAGRASSSAMKATTASSS